MADPLITMTIAVDRDGSIASDVQTHDNSYADVAVGLGAIKREIERVFADRKQCPFYPANPEAAQQKIIRTPGAATVAPRVNPACGVHGLIPCEGAGCICTPGVVASEERP